MGTRIDVSYTATTLSSNPATLAAGNLNGATLTVSLGDSETLRTWPNGRTSPETFVRGAAASHFTLTITSISGLSISGVTVTPGSRTATLTLSHTGSAEHGASIAVTVAAAAHSGSRALHSKTKFLSGSDYDADDDGLIDIRTVQQLSAMRWDLDGNGTVASHHERLYGEAFGGAVSGMGCPGTGCTGYELLNDLNFDTDDSGYSGYESGGTATIDENDFYYNRGGGWDPIGPASTPTNSTHFNTTLDGKGHSIKNLFINRSRGFAGLFGALRPDAVVRSLGLENALVHSGWSTATLAGWNAGRVAGVWATGKVRGGGNLGGLVGLQQSGGTIVASYSMAAVACTSSNAGAHTGGLVGDSQSGATVVTSYSTGAVTGACPTNRQYGLTNTAGTVTASYWDATTSGIVDDGDSTSPEGRSTTQLQTPTEYGSSGLYAAWDDQDVDGDGDTGVSADSDDDAWDFGTNSEYPVLKFGGLDASDQRAADAPSFGTASVAQQTGRTGINIQAFQIPAATHSGAITYTVLGLPPGLSFDVDGTGDCLALRTICGAPTRAGTFAVTVLATNARGGGTGIISFNIVVTGIEIDADAGTASTVEAGPLALTEGAGAQSDTYRVRLTSAPSASVTVTVTSGDTGVATVDTDTAAGLQSTLTFTTTSWSTWQTVTAAAVQDTDAANESVTITHAAGNSGGFNGVSGSLTVTVDDDEVGEVVVDANPSTAAVDIGSLLLDEASARAGNYAVYLSHVPTASVTVALASDNPAVTLNASALTFTTSNWATARTVTATTTEDADAADEAADVTHRANGGYLTATLRVGVADDERTGTDYDTDEDGLIEIASLAQLNAVRWDLDGDGDPIAANAADYTTAFPGASTGMGCPDGADSDQAVDGCIGYELARDLDFDTDGDGGTYTLSGTTPTGDSGDAYNNSGSGWDPIGPSATPTDSTHFNAVFDGNGYSIYNLFINRTRAYTALFAALRPSAVVRNLGLPGAFVYGGWSTGALAGQSWGRVAAVWSSGTVRGGGNIGGLLGFQQFGGKVVASYSTVAVTCTSSNGSAFGGGLMGVNVQGGTIVASYATGTVTGGCRTNNKHAVTHGAGTVTSTYWDTNLSGFSDDGNSTPPEGRTTTQLQAPRGYTGLYATWDEEDVNGDGLVGTMADDVWDFGTTSQHPVLKAAGFDTALQFASQGTDSAPDFGTASVTNKTYVAGTAIAPFEVPAATGGNGVLLYSASGLPAGLELDSDGSGTCGVPRAVCGTPTTGGPAATVTVTVTDQDDNTHAADFDTLTFTITVTAAPAVSSRNLALNEAAGSNTGTFTVALGSVPAATTTVTVVSADAGAVAVDPAALTFTTTDWSTAQTVTVTAQQDDDPDDETTTVTLATASVGVLARVTVTVADDDLGTVVVDADPLTDALDPGPLALVEDHATNNAKDYAVRLSARPMANVTVDVTSGDIGAVAVAPSSLTFTTANWSTAQTVRAATVSEADTLDESVMVTHTASGGGYGGTSTELRVAVSDAGRTGTDYDTDEDGLIEISTLGQLNAVRWDLNGDGSVASTDQTNYNTAFPSASAGMGCPAVSGTATCTGYELTADLDFDTDGDGTTHTSGTSDSGDDYHNSGAGWTAIGNRSAAFEATFDGNGHVIYNLFLNRVGTGNANRDAGLFGALAAAGVVRSLGVADAYVTSGSDAVGALVGRHYGRVEACWSSGSVTGNSGVGGLAGSTDGGSAIVAGYSKASVTVSGSAGGGGLAGWVGGDVAASYSIGAVTGGAGQHGLANGNGGATASYWDTEASGVATSTFGAGRTTSQLQNPTSATGPYAGWGRLDLDGDDDYAEAPWDFGTSSEYPALRVGSNAEASVFVQRGDYDSDDDGLIDVYSLAQLNAVRWDLDGDGAASSGNAGAYRKAFRHHRADMGCPTSTIDADDNDCAGFELMNDLDFDTDGDRSTHTNGTSDSGDAYHNGGSGWDPIGPAATTQSPPTDSTHFNATFDGRGHVIHNLFIDRSRTYVGLFAALRTSAVVRGLGLRDVWVDGGWSSAPLAGQSWGRTAAVWASGTVEAPGNVGGLVGWLNAGGTIVASYSTASVECTDTGAAAVVGGLVADAKMGSTVTASYSTGAVTGNCPTTSKGGLLLGGGTVAASYWDTTGSGIMDDQDSTPPEGRSRADLRAPTGYTGIYADWDDQDVDGDTVAGEAVDDDAWNFGDAFTHPVLKFGGLDTAVQIAQQPNVAPTFTGTLQNVTVANGHAIDLIQAPTATGGEGVGYTYSATGLPTGLVFDEDGTGTCQQARTICGTPSGSDGAATVTVYAHDGDVNRANSDRAALTFTLTVTTPTAAITATSPAALTENNLDNATVTVTLTNTTFGSGVTLASFTLNTNVPGASIDSVATVSAGDTAATLTLDYTGQDFDTARTLSVTVAASAHTLAGALSTATVAVAAGTGVRVAPPSLSLSEDPAAGGAANANVGTYSLVLESQPAGNVTVTATSADAAVHIDADGTPRTLSLTFTTTSWETAQLVTATAQQDDDAADESVQVTHAVTGYPGVTTATSVTVAVDDDETAGVVLDADPSSPATAEAGPLALAELSSATNHSLSYTVRLTAPPTAAVTVTATSADAGAVTVDTDAAAGLQSALRFTSTNWATAQAVTLEAQQDADGVNESVVVTNAATTAAMGEYANVSATVTATVADDEAPGFVFDSDPSTPATADAAPLNLDELSGSGTNSDDYTVRLSSQPTQAVTVTVTSPDTGAVTVGASTLTFTTSNWATAQAVTLTAQQDDDGADESVDVEHAARTATSSEYTGVSATFEAAVDDDETPAITLSPTSLNVNEQDGATYAVSLATEPTGAVTVAITGAADGISANPTSLAFTASNWDTARTVTASAADDQDSVNETVTLTHTATGATEYDTLTEDLEVTALDNDQPGLRVDPTSLTVPEGGSGTYVIRLNTEPSASVTVTVSGAGSGVTADTDGGVTGDQNTLTFTATSWGTDRTVTVSAAADDNGVDEVVTLSHAAAGGNYGSLTGSALPGVSVTADDDDVPAVLLDADPTTGNVDESGPQALDELAGSMSNSLGHTVRLATEPTADVTVTITSDDVGAVTVDDTQPGAGVQNWLRFTSSSWDTAQAVTLTAAQDADGVDEGVTVTHTATTASMGEYAGLSATLGATVDDDETPGFVFDRDPSTPAVADSGPLALDELSSSTTNSDIYTVRLAAQPTQDVTATVASDDAGAVTVGDTDGILNGVQNTLTFTTTSWDTPQTVTLTAQQDLDGADESLDIGHAASTATGSEYRGVSADFGAEVDDDETPMIRLSTATLTVPEQDRETYTVALDTEPSGGSGVVAVAITGARDGISTNPTGLSFTTSNWNTARTVTVRAADDQNSVNEQVTLRHTGSGTDYDGLTADIVVTATDDDRPGLRVSPTQLTVHENGSAGYTVRLNTEPSAEVTVTVGGMTAEVTVDADGVTPGSQTTLLFDATNWSAARTVTVSAADDDDATDESVPLTHATAGGDYTGLLLEVRPGVSVTVDDDDEPALVLDADPSTPGVIDPGPLTLNELSGHADREKGYTVRLATEPTGSVTVDVSSGDRAVHVDTGLTPRMRTLTFTTTNWSMPQTVTATAAEDDDASDESVVISHSASGSDYAGVSADLRAETTDDDTPALVVDAASLTGSGLAEGASGTYTVRLDTEPTARVLVSASAQGGVSVDADGGQSGLQPTLWFDAADWNVPQTVTVRARRDDDGASATATLRHSASGADYGGVTAAPVSFAVTDPDAPAVTVSALTLSVNEGSAALYQVSLATRPFGGAVTVALSSSAPSATVSSPLLVFTASDWSRPRQVTVQGGSDGTAMLSHTVSGADYGSVSPPTVAVTVRDTNAAGVRVEPPQLLLREGESGSYSVRLNTAPAGTVTVTAGGGAGLSLTGGGPLLFTASDWNVERTVSVTVADDDDPNDETLMVSHTVSGYAGVSSAPTLDVLVSDDDVPGFVFAPGGLSLSEGGGAASSATYRVRLATPPTGQVAVTASSDDAGLELDTDGTPRTLSLTFTTTNWSSGQTVSVRAVADGDRVSETAVLLHEGSGGGYDGASGLLRVRVKDSEARPPRPEPPSSSGPPEVAGLFEDLELGPGESVLVDLSGKFFDDGPLRHAAESSDPSVVTAVVSGSGLRVAGLSPGVATVTVTATDLDGLSVSQSFRVSVGRMVSFASAWASAPEGGTLRLELSLSRPAPSSGLVVSWSGGPDGDPATADADAADLGTLSGTAEFAPGGTEAFIEISVLDDDDAEPARERLLASLTPPPEGADWTLGLSEATLEIQEGVCDRTPAVSEALRGARECWAPTSLDLSRRGYLGLRGLGLSTLRAGDLQDLSGLRALHLQDNRLQSLPAGLFEGLASLERLRLDGNLLPGLPEGILAGLGRLSSLRLDGNRLSSLPPSLLSGAPGLQRLDLSGNRLGSLPPGLFAGVAGLSELNLEGNPGAPFALVMRLVRTDAEPWAPGPASVEARVAEGAPFALSAEVLADGAELSSASASVPAGALAGPPLQAEPTGPGAARLSLSGMSQVPQGQCGDVQDGMHPCFRGLSVQAGPALVLFKPPPGTTDEPPMPTLSANGERASFALDGLFSPSEAGDQLSYETESDRPDLVSVRIHGDTLLLLIANEDGAEGTAVVTVTATDPDGQSAALSFAVTVEFAPQGLLRSWRLEWMRTLREAAQ